MSFKYTIILLLIFLNFNLEGQIITGASKTGKYLPLLKDKKVGLVVNHTSLINNTHLVDTLLNKNIEINTIFAPEHGFRGKSDAGELIQDNKDSKTGIPVISLYGKNKKPSAKQLQNIDVMLFDIQDVGVRFYTYISTLYLVMKACAENNVKLIVLDRPNPNGMYIDGPVLKPSFSSFVGMMPIPVVYGMTIGELSKMINGENWINTEDSCQLKVIRLKNYNHEKNYNLPVKPSPNLPNTLSIKLYPSLCFFEGTKISVARGTHFPFQAIGYPDSSFGNFTFTPRSIKNMSKNPPFKGKKCYGIDFRNKNVKRGLTLKYLIEFYNKYKKIKNDSYFKGFFNLLAGNNSLKRKIKSGLNEKKIKKTWKKDLKAFKKKREKYLLYP